MNIHSFSGKALLAFAIAAACASAVPASAASIIVLDRTLPPEVKVTGTNFEVDERLGRVRLAVDFYDESFEGNMFSESFAVPGLSFDRESREVRYEGAGSVATCAVRTKILWGTSYPQTGACPITVTKEPRTAAADTGDRTLTSWVVSFSANEPARVAKLKR